MEYQTRKATREERAGWKKQFPGCNWGLVCGRVSNLVALDFDGEAGKALFAEHNLHGKQPTNLTGKGYHGLFLPPSVPLKNGVRIVDGLDIRADGGYIVIPRALIQAQEIRLAGRTVDAPAPPLPDWVPPLLDKRENVPRSLSVRPMASSGSRRRAEEPYGGPVRRAIPRKRTLSRGDVSGTPGMEQQELAPMPESELRSVILSIASKEASKAVSSK